MSPSYIPLWAHGWDSCSGWRLDGRQHSLFTETAGNVFFCPHFQQTIWQRYACDDASVTVWMTLLKNCPCCWRLSPLLVLRKQVATLESSTWQGTESGFENQRGAFSQWPVKVSASIQQEKEFLSSVIPRKLILPTVWVILEEDPSPVEPQMRL